MRWLALAGLCAMLAASVDAGFGPGQEDARFLTDRTLGRGPSEPAPTALPEVERGVLSQALAEYRAGRVERADATVASIVHRDARRLAEWAAVRHAALPFGRVQRFLDDNPDWPGRDTLLRRAEEALFRENPDESRVAAFFADRPPATAAGRVALAFARQAAGNGGAALALARQTWHADVLSQATELRLHKAFGEHFEPRDHRIRMDMFLMRGRWEDATRAAARLDADHARLVELRRIVEAGGTKKPPPFDAVPQALRATPAYLFSRARHERKRGNLREAGALLAQPGADIAELAGHDAWWSERRYVARALLALGDAGLAYRVAAAQPASADATGIDAAFHAGWIALRFLQRPQDASRHFARASEAATQPISIARGRYWQGRAAEAAGQERVAREHYARAAAHSATFYGQLARARIGRDELVLGIRPRPRMEADMALHASAAGRALAVLLDLDEPVLARALYAELAQSLDSGAGLEALAETARRRKDARSTQMIGRIALARGFPLVEHAFPTFGVPSIELPSPRVEAAMLHAIARQESAFDIAARSHAGARGLMQLMPATARETAQRARLPYEADRLTEDADYNVTLGATHLDHLLASLGGNLPLTLAAYNAGIGNVRRWIKAYGDPRDPAVDPVDWIEQIPFAETRDYVQRVIENLQVYRVRLDTPSPLLTEADLRRAVTGP